jgi:CBS domain containing-hemolysin-like protein
MDSDDYDSIGGLMIEKLDRLPEDQETIQLENGITLQAKGVQENRILKVLITLPATVAPEEEEAPAES